MEKICLYCKSKFTGKATKKFCSDKCKVYFSREKKGVIVFENGKVTVKENSAADLLLSGYCQSRDIEVNKIDTFCKEYNCTPEDLMECFIKFKDIKSTALKPESKLFNADKSTNLVEPKVEGEDKSNDAIEAKIKAILAEKIPEHRNTSMGKKVWAIEQNNRIKELQKQLK